MTDLSQAEKETEAKHQADNNKNHCLRYQAKTEAKHLADGDRNDSTLYQAKTEAGYQARTSVGTDFGRAGKETVVKYQDDSQPYQEGNRTRIYQDGSETDLVKKYQDGMGDFHWARNGATGSDCKDTGEFKTLAKRWLRVRLGFLGMDRAVERSHHLPALPSQQGEQGQESPETNQGAGGAVVKAIR